MPPDRRSSRRQPLRIRLVLPDLDDVPWLRGVQDRLVGRYQIRERITLPRLERPPRSGPIRRKKTDRAAAGAGRQETLAAVFFGALGLAVTCTLMYWFGVFGR
jgi:hypothetical protein